MNSIRSIWAIMNQSMILVSDHKKLLLFPLINLVGITLVILFFLLPVVLVLPALDAESMLGALAGWGSTYHTLKMGAWYLSTIIVLTFLNTAFYHEVLQAFNGNRVSITRGLAVALQHSSSILVWALFTGLVGAFIRFLEEKVGAIGRWILASLGITWSMASIFVIPILIREQGFRSPVTLLKTSSRLFLDKWGEGIGGMVSFYLMATIAVVGGALAGLFLQLMLGSMTGVMDESYAGWFIVVGMLVIALVCVLLNSFIMLLKNIYFCGLYIYATEGVIPEKFDEAVFSEGWTVKARK